MRRLILQMQTSVDGFVSAHGAEMQWQVWNWGPEWTWDARLRQDFNATFERIDTILLSRTMTEEGYLDHPATVGTGETIFDSAAGGLLLDRVGSQAYDCGIVVNRLCGQDVLNRAPVPTRGVCAHGGRRAKGSV